MNTERTANQRRTLIGVLGIPVAVMLVLIACDRSQTAECTPAESQTPIDTGQGTEYIDPQLWATLQHHADGTSGLPSTLTIALGWEWPDEDALFQMIEDAGGVRNERDDYIWQIPTESVLEIIQRPDVYYAEIPPSEGFDQRETATVEAAQAGPAWPPKEPMNSVLADVVKAYCLGIAAEQAAQYALFARGERVFVRVVIDDGDTREQVLAWLDARDIYALSRDNREDHDIAAYMPVAQIDHLAQAFFPLTYIMGEDYRGQGLALNRAHWPAEATEWEQAMIEGLLEAGTPQPDS